MTRAHMARVWRPLAAALAVVVAASLGSGRALAEPVPSRLQRVDFDSAALDGRRHYLAYLPRDYAVGARRYPVVYLLHGLGGGPRDWLDHAAIDKVVDGLVERRKIQPVIVIAPAGGDGYWTDHLGKGPGAQYGSFVTADVIADVDRRFRTRGADARAIVGVSMGGHGSLSMALMHPKAFRSAVSLGGALFPAPPSHRKIYKQVWGYPADIGHWDKTSPIALIKRLSRRAPGPALYLQCGDDDRLGFLAFALLAHDLLVERGVSHELRVHDGGHSWDTWTTDTGDWLRFIDRQWPK